MPESDLVGGGREPANMVRKRSEKISALFLLIGLPSKLSLLEIIFRQAAINFFLEGLGFGLGLGLSLGLGFGLGYG